MASNTPNLNLLKKDPTTDGSDTFNIELMLNENWDKIDAAAAAPPADKATPVDADWVTLTDTAAANARKKLTWSGVKATLKGYFDNLYAAATPTHAWSAITGKPESFVPSSHTHAADEITTGALSVARGGTEASDAAGARANLGACADRLADETATATGGSETVNQAILYNALTSIDLQIKKKEFSTFELIQRGLI